MGSIRSQPHANSTRHFERAFTVAGCGSSRDSMSVYSPSVILGSEWPTKT